MLWEAKTAPMGEPKPYTNPDRKIPPEFTAAAYNLVRNAPCSAEDAAIAPRKAWAFIFKNLWSPEKARVSGIAHLKTRAGQHPPWIFPTFQGVPLEKSGK